MMIGTSEVMNVTDSTSSIPTNPTTATVIVPIAVSTLVILGLLLSIVLVPIIIINNRRKRSHGQPRKEDSEQPDRNTGDEPAQVINNSVIPPVSQTLEREIETSGTHLYDELIKYRDQADQNDNSVGPSQVRHKNSSVAEPHVQALEETDQKIPTKDRDQSDLHTYAVLEEPIPPVPERTYRKTTHSVKKLPVVKEESDVDGQPFQTNEINRKERPHTIINMAEPEADGDRKVTGAGLEKVGDLANPTNHTYAVLEGPALPMRRHKTQSGAMRKKMASNKAKRFSDATHTYDSLGSKTESKFKKKSAPVLMSTSLADDNESSSHQYAVLEGPTPIIDHCDCGILEGSKSDSQLASSGMLTDGGTASSTYDKLAPKTVEITNENSEVIPSREGRSDRDYHERSTQVTTITYDDRLGQEAENGNPLETGHMYDTLEPEKKSVKPKFNKSMRNTKKKKMSSIKKQISAGRLEGINASHFYDVVEFKNEVESCADEQHQDSEMPAPAAAMKSAINSDRKISCEGVNVNTTRQRKLTHSLSSRTIGDVTEARKRSMTVFTASDTNLNRIIDTESEVHIYDTVEVFPISQRKRKRSGKRYRWLHLKEQLQQQQKMGHPMETTAATPTNSGYVTDAICMTTSSSVSSIHVPESPLTEPNCAEVYAYASLDNTQTYAQVGPYVPAKKGVVKHKEPNIEDSSEYAHLQHL